MKALKTRFKKGTALVLSLALTVGQFQILPHKVMAVQAAEESMDTKLSVTAFATKEELMNSFTAYGTSNDTIGKIVFGKDSGSSPLEWYVLGKDNGIEGENVAIFAASPIKKVQVFDDTYTENKTYEATFGIYESVPTQIYSNHYGASGLRVVLQEIAVNRDYFTVSEQSMMQATTITTNDTRNSATYTTSDILYALQGKQDSFYTDMLYVGSGDEKKLFRDKYWSTGDDFWLRTPAASKYYAPLVATTLRGVDYFDVINDIAVRPASNLSLSDVLFASAATAASAGTVTYGELAERTAMKLRLDGSNSVIGSVISDSEKGIVLAKKSKTATGTVSVVVQGNDGNKDWYYSKVVGDKVAIKASDLKERLGLQSDVELSDCKVWVETTVDNMSYAKVATEGTIVPEELSNADSDYLSVTAFATKEELMNIFLADGTNNTIGKLVFGKDSGGHPLEWYILGKDSSIKGENTAIFATGPIMEGQVFEDTIAGNKTYDASFGIYENNPSEVYPNHYGASDLRVAMQEIAVNKDYFTTMEQSMLQATNVTISDTKNNVIYTTTDKLYALKGDDNGDINCILRGGSQDEKILLMENYWKSGDSRFWLRTPPSTNENKALVAKQGFKIYQYSINDNDASAIRPASNLDLSSVLFASAATAATPGNLPYGEITEGMAMTLRMDGSNSDIGSVICDSTKGVVLAKKSDTVAGTVSVVVQGNVGDKDWYYSKVVEDEVAIEVSDLKEGLGLQSDIELFNCEVWIETTVDNVSYAKLATEGIIASEELSDANSNYLSVTTFATKEELMNTFMADGVNKRIGKILFGKDSANNPLEWYVLGKDSGITGENTAIFSTGFNVEEQVFEDNYQSNKTYEYSFGAYESIPLEVYANHYGASDLRVALQELAKDQRYFTVTEQSMMQATTITTKDTMNSATYATTDILYVLKGDDNKHYAIWAGSGDQKILLRELYWMSGDDFWLRTPHSSADSAFYAAVKERIIKDFYVYTSRVVRPASNLNLSSVLFASAAIADKTGTVEKGKIAEGTAMTLRMNGNNKDIGSVINDSTQGIVLAEKSATANGMVSVVVQGNDGFRDWYYSKLVADKEVIKASDIKMELELLSDINLADCKVWIETTVDNVSFVKMSVEGTIIEETTTNEPESSSKEETTSKQEESTTEPESSSKEEESTTESESSSKEEETTSKQEESTTEPESSGKEEESTTEPESSSKEEETTSKQEELTTEPESSSKEEESTTEPESSSKEEESTTEPELSSREEESTTEPESSSKEEESTTEPESSSKEEASTTEPESSSKEEETTTEPESSNKEEESTTKPEQTKKEITITHVQLSGHTYTYDGTAKKPKVVVTVEGKKLVEGRDYKVTYLDNVNEGMATVTVTGQGGYKGKVARTFTIKQAKITSVSIASTSYSYNGRVKEPAVTVKSGTKKLIKGTDYTVSYKNNILPGVASVVVRGWRNYTGTITKTFNITPSKVANFKQNTNYTTSKITMTWSRGMEVDGYAIYRSATKNGSYKYLKSVTATTYSNVGLKAGSKYYYKVRAYKTVNGKKIYGAYSDAKSMLTKPATPTGFTVALKSRTAKITWKKVSKAQGYEVYMTTSTYGSYKRIKNAGASTTSYNKTGLTKGKKYYFKMRAYTKTGTGAKVYSGYSKIKVVTVK